MPAVGVEDAVVGMTSGGAVIAGEGTCVPTGGVERTVGDAALGGAVTTGAV